MSYPYYFPSESNSPIIHQYPSQLTPRRPEREVTAGRLLWHLFLLGLTVITTTLMGTLLFFESNSNALGSGLLFSFTLIIILSAHEMGHYLTCCWYGVQATLPYFIPVPLGIGTFGAFIKIKSPIPNRRALFDIGIAGPLAGFVFAVPAAIIAHYYAATEPPIELSEGHLIFHSPLLFQLLEYLFQLPDSIKLNPIWFASWVGLLVTSLNLLPVGQLDGGHVIYAVFGRRGHRLLAQIIYACVLALALHALLKDGWIGWIVYALLLTFILRIGHPPVLDESEALNKTRIGIAICGLIVLLLCFMPVPITIVS